MPLGSEAKREYMRLYMRRRRGCAAMEAEAKQAVPRKEPTRAEVWAEHRRSIKRLDALGWRGTEDVPSPTPPPPPDPAVVQPKKGFLGQNRLHS